MFLWPVCHFQKAPVHCFHAFYWHWQIWCRLSQMHDHQWITYFVIKPMLVFSFPFIAFSLRLLIPCLSPTWRRSINQWFCACASAAAAPGSAPHPRPRHPRPAHAAPGRPPAPAAPRGQHRQPAGALLRPESPAAAQRREETPRQQQRTPERWAPCSVCAVCVCDSRLVCVCASVFGVFVSRISLSKLHWLLWLFLFGNLLLHYYWIENIHLNCTLQSHLGLMQTQESNVQWGQKVRALDLLYTFLQNLFILCFFIVKIYVIFWNQIKLHLN